MVARVCVRVCSAWRRQIYQGSRFFLRLMLMSIERSTVYPAKGHSRNGRTSMNIIKSYEYLHVKISSSGSINHAHTLLPPAHEQVFTWRNCNILRANVQLEGISGKKSAAVFWPNEVFLSIIVVFPPYLSPSSPSPVTLPPPTSTSGCFTSSDQKACQQTAPPRSSSPCSTSTKVAEKLTVHVCTVSSVWLEVNFRPRVLHFSLEKQTVAGVWSKLQAMCTSLQLRKITVASAYDCMFPRPSLSTPSLPQGLK